VNVRRTFTLKSFLDNIEIAKYLSHKTDTFPSAQTKAKKSTALPQESG